MSTSVRTHSTAESDVEGLRATPAFFPSSRMRATTRWRWGVASAWTVRMSAPAFAKSSTYRSGSTIIRWTSRGAVAAFRIAATTAGPMVMLGTKRPSITSTWSRSAPAFSTARTSSARRPKSAERSDGAM